MQRPPKLNIHPPLLNSATPWATGLEELRPLLLSPSTGAITTRTTLLHGFAHDPEVHRYLFFDPATSLPGAGTASGPRPPEAYGISDAPGSLNTLGYSPVPLDGYLDMIAQLASELLVPWPKTVIISVTGSPEDVAACYARIEQASHIIPLKFAMEVNLSCPNIPDAPPPAYDGTALASYLAALPAAPTLPVGVKTPPYTHAGQYATLVGALREAGPRISFVTATNTLGSCLILDSASTRPVLPGSGIGGMAGPPLHPLALGNVATIRALLDEDERTQHIDIIGVGGVMNGEGYRRMRAAGAAAVAVGTGLGRHGPLIFASIQQDIGSGW